MEVWQNPPERNGAWRLCWVQEAGEGVTKGQVLTFRLWGNFVAGIFG